MPICLKVFIHHDCNFLHTASLLPESNPVLNQIILLKKTPYRDKLLDVWRAIAVLGVLFDHLIRFRLGPVFPVARISELRSLDGFHVFPWFSYGLQRFAEVSGALGVQVFFVISGYIITTLLYNEEHSKEK